MLSGELIKPFLEETGRTFGYSSKYVHLSPEQILERASLVQEGRSIGKESEFDLDELNDFLERIFACSIIFMMHSVPNYISGDWFVESDGSTVDWYFTASKYISDIDKFFDYKHERKDKLQEIIEKRNGNIRF